MTPDELVARISDLRFRRDAHLDLLCRSTARVDYHQAQVSDLDTEIVRLRADLALIGAPPETPVCQAVDDDVRLFWTSDEYVEKKRAKQLCMGCPLADGTCAREALRVGANAAIWNGVDVESKSGQRLIRQLAGGVR